MVFFDTEPTGLPRNWKASVTNLDNWPRLVQLACLFYDRSGNLLSKKDFTIRLEGSAIPSDSSRIHGIATDRALREGRALSSLLQQFGQLLGQTNASLPTI